MPQGAAVAAPAPIKKVSADASVGKNRAQDGEPVVGALLVDERAGQQRAVVAGRDQQVLRAATPVSDLS